MIKVLPKNVAELIAAGEVVERPVSVVKELVENSIDSGATDITIEIKNGGITYIRVSDNGCGIPREEVPIAFLRHATSKLSTADQLNSIETLGFRGEALAAISAVSKTEMITKCSSDELGTSIKVVCGDIYDPEDIGCPNGTTIIVKDLFSFVPARMKFLKKDSSEAAAIASFVDKIAISHPEISFKFIKNGAEELHTIGDGRLDSAINSVFGSKFADSLTKVDGESWGVTVSGYTSKPAFPRANRNMQIFFVNNRLVRSKTFTAALDAAYSNMIPSGRFASCVLNININPSLTDINVHPSKLEVRFSDEHSIFDSIYHNVKNAITQSVDNSINPSKTVSINELKNDIFINNENKQVDSNISPITTVNKNNIVETKIKTPSQTFFTDTQTKVSVPIISSFKSSDNQTAVLQNRQQNIDSINKNDIEIENNESYDSTDYKFVGEIYKTYLVFENSLGVIFVDKHAAHERIIFNRLKNKFSPDSDAQLLLSPISVILDKKDIQLLIDNSNVLYDLGFEIDDFGNGEILVRTVPIKLNNDDVSSLLQIIADKLPKGGKRAIAESFYDDILHSISCKAAIKAGKSSSEIDANDILDMLKNDPKARFCPHGRPVCFEVKKSDLDKQFLR